MLIRGHEHFFKHHFKEKNEVLVTTLPVGMDSPPYLEYDQNDRAYILNVEKRVKDWKKKAIIRASGESQSHVTKPMSIVNPMV
jgi:hypothetical protein